MLGNNLSFSKSCSGTSLQFKNGAWVTQPVSVTSAEADANRGNIGFWVQFPGGFFQSGNEGVNFVQGRAYPMRLERAHLAAKTLWLRASKDAVISVAVMDMPMTKKVCQIANGNRGQVLAVKRTLTHGLTLRQ